MLEINKKSHRQGRVRRHTHSSSSGKVHKMFTIFIVLIVLGTVGVFVYMIATGKIFGAAMTTTYIQRTPTEAATKSVPLAKPKVTIELFEAQTNPGKQTILTARTSPNIDCTIKILYGKDNVSTTSAGLEPKKSDADGIVTWKWKVQSNMPIGKWPTKVSCGDAENPGTTRKNLIVSAAQPGMFSN